MDTPPVRPRRVRSPFARALALLGLTLALGYIGVQAPRLWSEYRALRGEWDTDVKGRVIGYPGVTPAYSYAASPKDWLHDDGDAAFLWAGWDRKAGRHNWFKIGKGEVTAHRLTFAMGRDTIRAIDLPHIEVRGGEIWERIPPEHSVAVGEFQGVAIAYPIGVLDKVLIINDQVHTKPILVVYTPFVADIHAVEMFSALIDGKRMTMGHSGYLWDGRPLLYDREDQGLWVPTNDGLKGVAGTSKGKVLLRIAHLEPVPWGDWSAAHPDGRLVAGAIRPDQKNQKP